MDKRKDRSDGVDVYPADPAALDTYAQAERDLERMRIPILLHADNPHERLYIAAMDGTGNSLYKDAPENRSIVAKIYEEVRAMEKQGVDNIRTGYTEGTFTQDNPITRYRDGITGYTFDRRVETAYHQFCVQAYEWLKQDPNAQIRVVGLGFSRGVEEVAALHRVIDERGILDPTDAKLTRDMDGLIVRAEYTKPPLVPPGRTLQAALLYDPVATNVTEHDRRMPDSVMSVLQITARDERRDQFKSTSHIPPGFSEDQRNYNATVAGSHSDIGDTYGRNGIGVRSGNLGVRFLNRISDRDFLPERAVPDDPALNVIHRSDQHLLRAYTSFGYRRDGERDRHDHLAPDALCRTRAPQDCRNKTPIDPALDRLVERRGTAIAPGRAAPENDGAADARIDFARPMSPGAATDEVFARIVRAVRSGDGAAMNQTVQAYERSEGVQLRLQGATERYEQMLAQERQAQQEQQAMLQAQQHEAQQAEIRRGPVLHR